MVVVVRQPYSKKQKKKKKKTLKQNTGRGYLSCAREAVPRDQWEKNENKIYGHCEHG
jgi:hypothetical protein